MDQRKRGPVCRRQEDKRELPRNMPASAGLIYSDATMVT